MKEKYDSFKHAKTRLCYHIIFSTKYRRPCLEGIEEELYSSMRYVAEHSRFRIEAMGADRDHIHLLVRGEPNFAPYQIVRRLKQVSTRMLWRDCESHLRKFYHGRKRLVWTNGYFCGTVGEVSEEKVLEYIKNQG